MKPKNKMRSNGRDKRHGSAVRHGTVGIKHKKEITGLDLDQGVKRRKSA